MSSCWNFSLDPNTIQWSTAHGDLHWANLLTPFTIVDWEAWGSAPVGFDVATLYCHALLIPEMATQVKQAFSYILESPQGQTALLYTSARLMRRIERGDYPDLEKPLKQAIRPILKPIFRF